MKKVFFQLSLFFSLFFLISVRSVSAQLSCLDGKVVGDTYCRAVTPNIFYRCTDTGELEVSCGNDVITGDLNVCDDSSGRALCIVPSLHATVTPTLMPVTSPVVSVECRSNAEIGDRYCKPSSPYFTFECTTTGEQARTCGNDIVTGNPNVCDESSGRALCIVPSLHITPTPVATQFSLCNQAGRNASICNTCMSSGGLWTGVGCVPYNDSTETVRAILTIGLGIAGGAVVLMTLAGAFLITTSQGDPKRVDEGKSLITSAVAGILFIIFSVTILRFIGVNILRLPDFG